MKILSCGAGQQSTALALMSCDNVLHPGKFPLVPVYDAILFCDLGGEREWVYRQVDFIKEQCAKAGIPFYVLRDRNDNRRRTQEYVAGEWWSTEPDVGRVAHGVPARVDRLKCLGNAVVPEQFYPIFEAIYSIELNS